MKLKLTPVPLLSLAASIAVIAVVVGSLMSFRTANAQCHDTVAAGTMCSAPASDPHPKCSAQVGSPYLGGPNDKGTLKSKGTQCGKMTNSSGQAVGAACGPTTAQTHPDCPKKDGPGQGG